MRQPEWVRPWRLALRRWRRRWRVAVLAVATAAVALGATTALFSVWHRLVLDPLPFPQSSRLVWLRPVRVPAGPAGAELHSAPNALDYRRGLREITAAFFFQNEATVVGRGDPLHVDWTAVTGDFFPVLGVRAALGRTLGPDDELHPDRAVISDALWRSKFGADPHVVGQTLDLDNGNNTIVGVMPAGFDYPAGSQVWRPEQLAVTAARDSRGSPFLGGLGRLRPGATLGAAQQEMTALTQRLARAYPAFDAGRDVRLVPLAEEVAGPVRATLAMMMLATLLVLAIACANVANLLLAESVERWREMALRASLGATRAQLLGQLLAEAWVLAVAAGGAGWALAAGLLAWARRLSLPALPQLAQVGLDGRVLAFSAVVTAGAALWFALAPAWQLLGPQGRRNLLRAASDEPLRSRLPEWVVVAEVAATVVLLVAAGLLGLGLRRLGRVNPGFAPDHVLTFRAAILWNTIAEFQAEVPYFLHLNQQLQAAPGVVAAGLAGNLPMAPALLHLAVDAVAAPRPPAARPQAEYVRTFPGYLAAMRIPVRGRRFTADDVATAPRVVILSQSLADRLFPGRDALGEGVRVGNNPRVETVIGVAANVPAQAPGGEPALDLYACALQAPADIFSGAVRVRGNPYQLLPQLRRISSALDPQVPIYEVATLDQVLGRALAPDRLRAELLLIMAALALLMAVAGLYGVLAHGVAQRRRDIGIRMALGASLPQVRRWVLGRALRLIGTGIVLGLAAATWLRPGLQRFLPAAAPGAGVGAELGIWAAVPLLLLAVGLLASYLPARQAAQVDPLRALRTD